MSDFIPLGAIQVVLILAPLLLGASIGAYHRLRRHVCRSPDLVTFFRNIRWDSCMIVLGGLLMLRGAVGSHTLGTVVQIFGLVLALEFFYVAYVNLRVSMSANGLLLGMNFSPWRRFAGYTWVSERDLELTSHTRCRYRFRVPARMRARVQEIVDLNILK